MAYRLRRISDKDGYGNTPPVLRLTVEVTLVGRMSRTQPAHHVLHSTRNPRMISRLHAEFRLEKGNWYLKDFSLNGTYLNYKRPSTAELLTPGDVICFGHVNGYNIKPGQTVPPFKSELKFIFEKIASNNELNEDNISFLESEEHVLKSSIVSKDLKNDVKRSEKIKRDIEVSSSSSSNTSSSSESENELPDNTMSAASRFSDEDNAKEKKIVNDYGKSDVHIKSIQISQASRSSASSGIRGGGVAVNRRSSGISVRGGSVKKRASSPSAASKDPPPKQRRRNSVSLFDTNSNSTCAAATGATWHVVEEPCAAGSFCSKPADEDIKWVGCDQCEAWYHLLCTRLSPRLTSRELESLDFVCDRCKGVD